MKSLHWLSMCDGTIPKQPFIKQIKNPDNYTEISYGCSDFFWLLKKRKT